MKNAFAVILVSLLALTMPVFAANNSLSSNDNANPFQTTSNLNYRGYVTDKVNTNKNNSNNNQASQSALQSSLLNRGQVPSQYLNQYSKMNIQSGQTGSSQSLAPIGLGDILDSTYSMQDDFYYNQVNTKAFDNMFQAYKVKSPEYLELSPIEEMFNGKTFEITGNPLRQVGYDIFLFSPIINIPGMTATGKFDSSYRLNIGERVNVNLQGDSVDIMALAGSQLLAPSMIAEVDSRGELFVQGIGSVPAEGKTLAQVQNSLTKLANAKYKHLKVQLSIAAGQDFSVFVFGQVNKPGKVSIGNNSTVFDAINAAGGIQKTGSLRNITYTSNNKQQSVDLYKTIFLGQGDNIILKPNDRIFVNKIGNVVALKNGVIVPGIYEAKDGESIQKLVNYAGGFSPTAQIDEVTLVGFDKDKKQKVARTIDWSDAKKTIVRNGDSLEFRELYNEVENTVTIQGNIKHPTTYAYKEGMRLSDILKSEDELLEETFINQAVIRRVSGKDNKIETIPVYLKDFFSGLSDPQLQPRDIITVYKNTNSDFVDIYGCINIPKHLAYIEGMMLDDVMADIQFMESDIEEQDANVTEVSMETGEKGVKLSGKTTNINRLIPAENVAVEITGQDGITTLYYLYDVMINSEKIKTIPILPNDRIFFRTLRDNEIIKSVKVTGFVKNPGVYTTIEGKKLSDVIKMAGGLHEDADLRGIIYKRVNLQDRQIALAKKNNEKDIKLLEGRIASAYKATVAEKESKMDMINMLKTDNSTVEQIYDGQIALNIKNNDLDKIKPIDNVIVQDGDTIYIPRMLNQVSVMGEVYNEQSFVYNKGARARYYIGEVGGYTPNANKFRMYKVGVNGRAVRISKHSAITPGDTIIVPRKIAGNDYLTPICDALRGIASLISTAFIVTKI